MSPPARPAHASAVRRRGVVLPFVLAGWGCAHAAATPPAPPLPPTVPQVIAVALVDPRPWESGGSAGVVDRIELRLTSGVDTVPEIRTRYPPVVVDGSVLGYECVEDRIVHAFRYDVRDRSLRRLPLPPDLNPVFSAPAVSPTGEYVAYVVVPGDNTAAGAVRRWPDGPSVMRSASIDVPGTDAPAEYARWLDPVRFEIYVDLSAERWHRIRGSVAVGTVLADTVTGLP